MTAEGRTGTTLKIAPPVTAALLGWIILDQTFTPVQMLGLTLSLGAIAYGALVGTRRTTVR